MVQLFIGSIVHWSLVIGHLPMVQLFIGHLSLVMVAGCYVGK